MCVCSAAADIPEEDLQLCGAGTCKEIVFNSASNSTRPEQKLIYTLVGSYIGVGVLAMIIVAVFLDNIDHEQTREFRGNREPICSTFLATFLLLKDWRLVTLIPLTMYSGFEQSFLSGEYTKVRGGGHRLNIVKCLTLVSSLICGDRFHIVKWVVCKTKSRIDLHAVLLLQNYVTCALGIRFVGFAMISFGASNSLCSYGFGRLAEYTGRGPLFFIGKSQKCIK